MKMLMALSVAVALMVAGCGGGLKGGGGAGMPSVQTPTPTTYGPGTVPLPTGHTLVSGTLPAGQTQTVGEADGQRTTIRCTAGSCMFTVAPDGTVTLVAGNLRIEFEDVTVVTSPTPTPPTTPTPVPAPARLEWKQFYTLNGVALYCGSKFGCPLVDGEYEGALVNVVNVTPSDRRQPSTEFYQRQIGGYTGVLPNDIITTKNPDGSISIVECPGPLNCEFRRTPEGWIADGGARVLRTYEEIRINDWNDAGYAFIFDYTYSTRGQRGWKDGWNYWARPPFAQGASLTLSGGAYGRNANDETLTGTVYMK